MLPGLSLFLVGRSHPWLPGTSAVSLSLWGDSSLAPELAACWAHCLRTKGLLHVLNPSYSCSPIPDHIPPPSRGRSLWLTPLPLSSRQQPPPPPPPPRDQPREGRGGCSKPQPFTWVSVVLFPANWSLAQWKLTFSALCNLHGII